MKLRESKMDSIRKKRNEKKNVADINAPKINDFDASPIRETTNDRSDILEEAEERKNEESTDIEEY